MRTHEYDARVRIQEMIDICVSTARMRATYNEYMCGVNNCTWWRIDPSTEIYVLAGPLHVVENRGTNV